MHFQTFRSDGSLQFDAGIAPLAFLGKGSVTTVSTTGSSPHWSGSSPSSALIPANRDSNEVIAVYLQGYGYARYGTVQHPTSGVWYHVYHTMAPLGTTVTYYRFVPASELPPATYGPGVEWFDETGKRLFHTDMYPMIPVADLTGLGASSTLPAGRTYATVAQSQAGHERYTYDGSQEVITNDKGQVIARVWNGYSDSKLYGVQWSGRTATLVTVAFNDQTIQMDVTASPSRPPDSEFYHIEIEDLLVLDVTGL